MLFSCKELKIKTSPQPHVRFGRSCLSKAALKNRLFPLFNYFPPPPKLAFNGEVQAERLWDPSRAVSLGWGGRGRSWLTLTLLGTSLQKVIFLPAFPFPISKLLECHENTYQVFFGWNWIYFYFILAMRSCLVFFFFLNVKIEKWIFKKKKFK